MNYDPDGNFSRKSLCSKNTNALITMSPGIVGAAAVGFGGGDQSALLFSELWETIQEMVTVNQASLLNTRHWHLSCILLLN